MKNGQSLISHSKDVWWYLKVTGIFRTASGKKENYFGKTKKILYEKW